MPHPIVPGPWLRLGIGWQMAFGLLYSTLPQRPKCGPDGE
jgi:hypothetical protein